MGLYINPGNENFAEIRKKTYIDKSKLIQAVNTTLESDDTLSCVSRPRRFGKSYAAQMLCAYYSCGCSSAHLFDDLDIASDASYSKYRNQFNVIYLDIASFFSETTLEKLSSHISSLLMEEISHEYPSVKGKTLKQVLALAVEASKRKFFAIIDEWDAPIRDKDSTEKTQKSYLEFLRMLFKSDITKKVFTGAYMTGILPIKKDGSQSAISEFIEYDMITPP